MPCRDQPKPNTDAAKEGEAKERLQDQALAEHAKAKGGCSNGTCSKAAVGKGIGQMAGIGKFFSLLSPLMSILSIGRLFRH